MAGCGQCPDTCNCVISDGENIYEGAGTPDDPIVIPRDGTPWEGLSSDDSITITPGDVVALSGDGHKPDLTVNWCQSIDQTKISSGELVVFSPDDEEDCRPKLMRDSVEGEFIGSDGMGGWAPVAGAMSTRALLVGMIIPWSGLIPNLPSGFLYANGSLADIAQFPELFAMYAHVYNGGVDPGGGQFRLPDLRGRAVIGFDDLDGGAAGRVTTAIGYGANGGTQDVTLGVTQIPAHSHGVTDPGHTHTNTATAAAQTFVTFAGATADAAAGAAIVTPSGSSPVGNPTVTIDSATTGITIQNAGGGLAHPNMPPWLALSWIIVAA